MKITKKILSNIVLISAVCVIVNPIISSAALQSNGGTPATKNINDWMLQIRQMQGIGGTLGRTDTINTENLKSNATDLDIHMEKNTEFGAMSILSASAYGNPNKINDGDTTTGNSSGIVMKINKEWVAAGRISGASTYVNASSRYKDNYEYSYVAKKGDAISETAGWHGSGASTWLRATELGGYYQDAGRDKVNYYCGLLRSYSGSIFSYYGHAYHVDTWNTVLYQDAYFAKTWPTRAVIVVGTGL